MKTSSFNHDTMTVSASEAKLACLWATNGATIQQVWILKFTPGPEKFPCLSRDRPLGP